MFSVSTSASKWVTDPALEVGRLVASPIANTFGGDLRLERVRIGGNESELVAQTAGALDERRPSVERNGDQQVERHLPLVVADQASAVGVDLPGCELGDQLDPLLIEQPGQVVERRPAW